MQSFAARLFLGALLCAECARVKNANPGSGKNSVNNKGGSQNVDAHCKTDIGNLAMSMHQFIQKFADLCGVLPTDIDGTDLTEGGVKKICGNKDCLAADFEEPTGMEDLKKRCTDSNSLSTIAYAKPGYDIAVSFYEKWLSCDRSESVNANVSAPSSKTCANPSMVSHNCVADGESISEEECGNRGCCWDPPATPRPGRNWCYKDASRVDCEKKCPVEKKWNPADREECTPFLIIDQFIKDHPDPEVRGKGCSEVGCCWDPLSHGSNEPWCFISPCLA
jgi:hypothetical protein